MSCRQKRFSYATCLNMRDATLFLGGTCVTGAVGRSLAPLSDNSNVTEPLDVWYMVRNCAPRLKDEHAPVLTYNKGSTAFINHWGDCVTLCCNVVTEHTKVIVKKYYWTSDRRHYIFKSQCLNTNKADNSDLLSTLTHTHPWSRESSSDLQI